MNLLIPLAIVKMKVLGKYFIWLCANKILIYIVKHTKYLNMNTISNKTTSYIIEQTERDLSPK